MSLDHDPRTGYAESGTVTIAAGDGSTPQTALQIPSDALFKLTEVKIEYAEAGTVDADVEVYDEADGTTAANASDKRDEFLDIGPDTRTTHDGDYRDFEEDVLVATANGNQDDNVTVTVHGFVLTDLSDMVSF